MTIKERIETFKKELLMGSLTNKQILDKYLIDGTSYFFNDYLNNLAKEDKLKKRISLALSVEISDVHIVGSGKLGFSLNPKHYFKEFDGSFIKSKLNKDKSDIDVAVISSKLYGIIGEKMYNYTAAYEKKWGKNEYYTIERAKLLFPVPVCYKYFEYFTKGWFRPDFKPFGFEPCTNGTFEELKGLVFKDFNRKIGLAIYQNKFYFENYHLTNINNLLLKIKTDKI
jgi:hypothetical protein